MPKKVSNVSVTVIRDGKRQTIAANSEPFDFTKDEIAEINAAKAGALRDPVNESSEESDEAKLEAAKAEGSTKTDGAIKRGSKSTSPDSKQAVSTAALSDSEVKEKVDPSTDEDEDL